MRESFHLTKRSVAIAIVLAAIVAIAVCARFLPIKMYLQNALDWAHGLGMWGPVIIAALYIPACVLMVPGTILTLGAGALFGLMWGAIAVSAGSTLGACAAFLVGRTVAREWVAKRVARNPKFRAIDEAVGREGFKIVILTRLSPIFPFNLLNYAFSITRVSFRDYALASWIGMLPGTFFFVYIGSLAHTIADTSVAANPRAHAIQIAVQVVGLIAAGAVVAYVTRVARKALREATPEERTTGEP